MSIIQNKILWWESVEDAASYRIRIISSNIETPIISSFPFSIIPGTFEEIGSLVELEANISTLTVKPTDDGVYNIYITAVDVVGNESDPLIIPNVFLDFNPPNAPARGGFRL